MVKAYDEREEELGEELMRALERFILLQIIDERWREHLHDMDYLREGIHLRGFAQIDPLVAYKNEGFEMFGSLMNGIWEEFARYIFHVEVEIEGENGQGAAQQQPQAWGTGPTRAPPATSRMRAAPRPTSRAPSRPRRRVAPSPPAPRRLSTPPTARRRQSSCRMSRRATWTSTTASAATTPAGAAQARNSRSAMEPVPSPMARGVTSGHGAG